MKGSRLRSRLPVVLKPCKLQYKMDLTLKNPSVVFKKIIEMLPISFIFTIQNQLFPLRCRLGSPWAPCIHPDFERYPPKWFLAITCAIWLRLIFRGRGSAWFFGAHLLFFHARVRILEARSGFLDLGSTFWPGEFFGVKNSAEKIVLWRNDFVVGF